MRSASVATPGSVPNDVSTAAMTSSIVAPAGGRAPSVSTAPVEVCRCCRRRRLDQRRRDRRLRSITLGDAVRTPVTTTRERQGGHGDRHTTSSLPDLSYMRHVPCSLSRPVPHDMVGRVHAVRPTVRSLSVVRTSVGREQSSTGTLKCVS